MDKQIETTDVTRPQKPKRATGKPGVTPTWSSSAKTIVGTAASARSRVYYTIGQGTLNEIYFGDVEQANTRSVRFLITGEDGFFSDEAIDAEHIVTNEAGIPSCRIESTCKAGRYRIVKEVCGDQTHNVVVVRVHFIPSTPGLRLYLHVDPHLGDMGANNNAWVGQYKGCVMMVAERGAVAMAATCSAPIKQACAGYAGKTDGHTRLSQGKPLPTTNLAEQGNVDLTAEVDYAAVSEPFVFAVGFGTTPPEAAQDALAGVLQKFDVLRNYFEAGWREEQARYLPIEDLSGSSLDLYRVSTAVLETHQSKRFPGGFIASLSLPWGFARSDKDTAGYHVLWPRDMVETAMGKLASGDALAARATLFYLCCTQESDGGWSQNLFLDGSPHWTAKQMDGTALPILLADQLRRENALDGYDASTLVAKAVPFLLRYGPWTEQDRWEELPGYSPYTTATQVAALLAAADFADLTGKHDGAEFLRDTADAWQDTIDEFTYVVGTPLAEEHGINGYYARIAPPRRVEQKAMGSLMNKMGNLPFGQKHQLASEIVSPDALALVRFGLRAADDPRMLNTVKVIDATLKRETTTGSTWVRSSKDGYGEHDDGSPYKKTGVGRGWPLLAGERAHYEIAAGNQEQALELLKTMSRQTSACGMMPEQVWDADDIPERLLLNGRPSGSAMPLVWTHSEYIKLLRSLHANAIWDLPPQAVARYVLKQTTASFQIWTPRQKRGWVSSGKDLRIDLEAEATVSFTVRGESQVVTTSDSAYGVHFALLPVAAMTDGENVRFTVTPADPNGPMKAGSFTVRVKRGG